jgi:hypothetical protein
MCPRFRLIPDPDALTRAVVVFPSTDSFSRGDHRTSVDCAQEEQTSKKVSDIDRSTVIGAGSKDLLWFIFPLFCNIGDFCASRFPLCVGPGSILVFGGAGT